MRMRAGLESVTEVPPADRARDTQTDEIVALKKVRMDKEKDGERGGDAGPPEPVERCGGRGPRGRGPRYRERPRGGPHALASAPRALRSSSVRQLPHLLSRLSPPHGPSPPKPASSRCAPCAAPLATPQPLAACRAAAWPMRGKGAKEPFGTALVLRKLRAEPGQS